jgi:predicted metalloprotease with PDZ domain
VLVRSLKITGFDLNLFEFDHDLTWVGFFLDAEERVLGRYGGRDASGPDGRLSLAGLRYTMRRALARHREKKPPAPVRDKPLRAEDYPAAKSLRRGECIHCHQINEFRRALRISEKKWHRDERYSYPLPENIGLTLEVDRGDVVKSVVAKSVAEKAGIRAGDRLVKVNGDAVASQADVQYALHRAPWSGKLPITGERAGKRSSAELSLAAGWRKYNLAWRPSLLDLMPALTAYGDELTPAEKKALGLPAARLAFRQDKEVHARAKAAGVRAGDVIVGIDDYKPEMTRDQFLAFVRREYLIGDKVTLRVLRDGKPLGLPMTLK